MSQSKRLFLQDLSGDLPVVRVGNFVVQQPVGQGSMGAVWKGKHVDQDVEVALKVILSEKALHKNFHRAFRQEVRSIAELNHPFIVDVYDYGTVDDAAESASLGQLRAGSPYLVMEYATHGSVATGGYEKMDWEMARLVVFAVLDALAHSHARGVLHRDVKPQNILLTTRETGPGIKLTDYGLAYALRENQQVLHWHRAAGTPEYMAPEQLTGAWRQYGPATDLYALGCVTYELLAGRPPFRGDNVVQIARAHLEDELPALPEDIDVPEEIEAWLGKLLAKKRTQRFSTAADAARALRQIDRTHFDEERLHHAWQRLINLVAPRFSFDGSPNDESLIPTHSLDVLVRNPPANDNPSSSNEEDAPPIIHIPDDWSRNERLYSSRRMVGTGRGIFEMRRLPFLGRGDERDRLWRCLRRCKDRGEPHATLLLGPSGVGKSYLARWFCDRVAELGVAQVFRVHHHRTEEIVDQLAVLLRRRYCLDGRDRSQIEDVFRSLLQELGAAEAYEWEALAELTHTADDPTASSKFHFATTKQRWMVYVRFFERLSKRGPILFWFDDVQWGPQTLHFVHTLLTHPTLRAPIYVVMTGRDDLLSKPSPHRRRLASILDCERADQIEIAPLDEQTLRRLVKEALFLDPAAAYEVTRRAGGNPRHALEIVGDWIDRDLLEATLHGYSLTQDAQLDPPGDGAAIWSRVVNRLAGGCDDTRVLLEMGALLGERFPLQVWRHAAEHLGLSVGNELVESLLQQKHLVRVGQRLEFTQNWLREALFSSAEMRGRWTELNRICARALDECATSTDAIDERVGFLLLEAGKPVEGGQRLLSALRRRYARRDYVAMIYLSQRALQALDDDPTEPVKELRTELLLHLAHGWHNVAANDRCLQYARQAAALAEELDNVPWRGVAARYVMGALYIVGDIEGAKAEADIATSALAGRPEFADTYAQCLLSLAHIALMEDHYDQARVHIDGARKALAGIDAPVVECQIEYVHLKALFLSGQDDKIEIRDIEALLQRCLKAGTNIGAAHCANVGGEVMRRRGQLDQARSWYQTSLDHFQLVEPDMVFLPYQNLALIALEQGRLNVAATRAEAVLQQLRRIDRPQVELHAMAVQLPQLATGDAPDDLHCHLDKMEAIIDDLGFGTDPDLAMCVRIATEKARQSDCTGAVVKRLTELHNRVEPTPDRE